jgi:hypothetical protein
MSKKYPECPLHNHDNCKHAYSPKVCALSREDKICLRKRSTKKNMSSEMTAVKKIAVALDHLEQCVIVLL